MWTPCAKQRATLLYHLVPWIRFVMTHICLHSSNRENQEFGVARDAASCFT